MFVFNDRESNPQYEGLTIISQKGRRYKSYESVFWSSTDTTDASKFYSFVGLKLPNKKGILNSSQKRNLSSNQQSSTEMTPPPRKKSATLSGPLTPHALARKGCGDCENCMKPPCSRCVCCKANEKASTESGGNCCLQKVRTRLRRRNFVALSLSFSHVVFFVS